jgi:hypothetical protein
MDKAGAMRTRLIEQVTQMLRHPGMYGINDQDFETMCKLRLDDLRFLDDLPELTRDELGLSNKYRSCGIPGPFRETFGDKARYYSEVASATPRSSTATDTSPWTGSSQMTFGPRCSLRPTPHTPTGTPA